MQAASSICVIGNAYLLLTSIMSMVMATIMVMNAMDNNITESCDNLQKAFRLG